MQIKQWLHKPYPLISDIKVKLAVSLAFGFFIYFFLLSFQPFGLADIVANKSLYILGFGVITFLVMLFNNTVVPAMLPTLFEIDKWIILKNFLFVLWNVVLITLSNYSYNTYVGGSSVQQHDLFTFIAITISVGIFPIIILVFLNELYLNGKHSRMALALNNQLHSEHNMDKLKTIGKIHIVGETKQDSLEFEENNLIFIKADNNYCLVHYLQNSQITTQLLRITLKSFEDQVEHSPNILRCHRSYIVNKQQISKISGNARAYYLHFDGCDDKIPLSRGFQKDTLLN